MGTSFLILLGFMVAVVALFITTYLINEKTKAPDIDVDISACGGCHNISCGHHEAHRKTKEVK
ncbi:MAG: hypothetical protein RR543_00815 [Erysipelotrichales bacterium]